MRFIYFTIKFLPYWAIPLILIFGEMAYIFRRRGNRTLMMRMGGIAAFFLILTTLFFALRWDTTLYPWVQGFLNS